MTRPKLTAKKRKIIGKKVKKLRKEGVIPANVYGKNLSSLAIEVLSKDFAKIYSEVGETGLIDLLIEGEDKVRPVLIHNVQLDPIGDSFLHVDFHQVSLTEKVTATIPIELIGKSPAEVQKLGILVQEISEVEIEALPTDLPEHFQIDVSRLEKVGDAVFVKDIQADKKKIEIKTEENLIVAKIDPLAKEEVVTPSPTEEDSVQSVTQQPEEDRSKEKAEQEEKAIE